MIWRRPPASLLLLAYGVLVLVGCAPLGANRPDICSYVRGAVSAGDFPLDLASLQYPECHAVARR